MSQTTATNTAVQQHAVLGIQSQRLPCRHTTHPEAQWFPLAGLGLFIHWGIASVHGDLDLSWGMMADTPYDAAAQGRNKLCPEEYWQLANRFRPHRYDPDRWLAAAAAAGFQYAVLTTMHHDGYTLWPSRYSDLGVHVSLEGRDLVRSFVEACRRHGLKVGLYYSPPDWYIDRRYMSFHYRSDDQNRFPGRRHFDTRHHPCSLPPKPPEHDAQRRQLCHQRVGELLTNYGRIDLIWFDGGPQDPALGELVRRLQPHIVVNSRSCDGDYADTECQTPTEKFSGWFETCHCWQESNLPGTTGKSVDFWGYLKSEQYKSTVWMLTLLSRLRAWGGNLLVNVGPRPDGELPPVVYERFQETAAWMQRHRPAVIGCRPGPYPERASVPVTIQGHTWYVHLLPGEGQTATLQEVPQPKTISLLGSAELLAPSTFHWQGGTLTINTPPALRTSSVDILAVEWSHPVPSTDTI